MVLLIVGPPGRHRRSTAQQEDLVPKVVEYHRPSTIEEAVRLLSRPTATVLAGGTLVNATPYTHPVIAVDIQALGLDGITEIPGARIKVGATTTLQQLADHESAPALIRTLAEREATSTLRTLATLGGTVAAGGSESELVTGLLACEAEVTLRSGDGTKTMALSDLLADCDHLLSTLIVEITLATDGTMAAARTGRTPGDRAIVSAVARRRPDGVVVLALSGIAPTPRRVESADAIDPIGDFRGSAEYRKHLARVHTRRVLAEVGA